QKDPAQVAPPLDGVTEGEQPEKSGEALRRFRLPIFEGPLDLLLHLIKRNELDPQEVATSIITDQYLQYLQLLDSLNLDLAGEYLVMAATLLLIKSYSLLPHPGVADTEDGEELKRDLVERLLEYQRYREAGAKLGERPMLGRDVFAAPGETVEPSETVEYRASLFDLVEALREVLKRLSGKAPRQIVLRDIPVAERMPVVLEAIDRAERVEFAALFEDLTDHSLVIATFLALLELIRRGQVLALQQGRLGPIVLSRKSPSADQNSLAKGE
ncbi:MAG TPA: segregation/condensation protein A, partial [Candidatus Binataceae bacterium]|nr:segregation/condensation protein A [Candidatus Binataceae bacterium]